MSDQEKPGSTNLVQEPSRKPKDTRVKSRFRTWLPGLAFLAVLLVTGLVAWKLFFTSKAIPENIITLSGRIEGDDSAVASKSSGRILEVRVREGDTVTAGDTIAILDDEQIRAREEQARAAVTEADSKANAARAQVGVLEEQLKQSQLQAEQARIDATGRVHQAENEVAVAQAEVEKQEAAYQLAAFNRQAYTRLAATGAVSVQKGKEAVSNADQQAEAVVAAKRRVQSARGALLVAQANLENPAIRSSQAGAVRKQIAQQQQEVASATAKIQQARAQLSEAQATRDDLNIKAPFSGTIVTRAVEPGEVVQAGTPIVTLVDLSQVYLRGYVPEGQIGKVKVSQAARVYLDSNPNQAIEAVVSRIDPEATFTPENTYFRDERVKQVVGVKLQLRGATGLAKPGMPADGEILTGGSWPSGRIQ